MKLSYWADGDSAMIHEIIADICFEAPPIPQPIEINVKKIHNRCPNLDEYELSGTDPLEVEDMYGDEA